MQNNSTFFTIGAASKYLGISVDTLRRWETKGLLHPFRSPGKHRYYREEDLKKVSDKKYFRIAPTKRRNAESLSKALLTPDASVGQSTDQLLNNEGLKSQEKMEEKVKKHFFLSGHYQLAAATVVWVIDFILGLRYFMIR